MVPPSRAASRAAQGEQEEAAQEEAVQEEARKRDALGPTATSSLSSSSSSSSSPSKEAQRDLILQRVRSAPPRASPHRMLGLREGAGDSEVMLAVRLAMRLLHPDRSINLTLKGTTKGRQLEAAFKRVNNLERL